MAVTTTTELDPMFIKALGYLRSSDPDSTENLTKMLDDAIEQSYRKKHDTKLNLDKGPIIKSQKHSAKITKSVISRDAKKDKELAQKRQFEKIQKDLEELDQDVSKKSRLDLSSSPASAFLTSDVRTKSESRGSPSASSDVKDFDLEMDDLACFICKSFSSDKGSPVECQECHNMYHRECHNPPISYQDANDPRCVWYCSWCTKNMKKVAKQINTKIMPVQTNPARERLNSLDAKNKSAFVTPFKRNEIKTSLQSSGNGSGGSLSGWAALSGKSIPQTSKLPTSKTLPPTLMSVGVKSQSSSATLLSKEKREKAKAAKSGPKLAVSDAWAEALGADLPAAPAGLTKTSSHKASSKPSSSWTSNPKSSVFPKVAATTTAANAEKKLQMLKKKAKLHPKKSKI